MMKYLLFDLENRGSTYSQGNVEVDGKLYNDTSNSPLDPQCDNISIV